MIILSVLDELVHLVLLPAKSLNKPFIPLHTTTKAGSKAECKQSRTMGRDRKGAEMILLDLKDSRPIYEQVVDKFRLLILNGVLKGEDKMPSVRTLAMELSINPNTIQRAYGELERQGYIYTVKGRGNFVSEVTKLKEDYRQEVFEKLDDVCDTAFRIGMKGSELIDRVRENEDKRGDEGE